MFAFERAWRTISFASLVILTLAAGGGAQTSRVAGAVQGNVTDQTGGAVAGARVWLRSEGTNQTRTVITTADGAFRAGELPVGRYELRVESPASRVTRTTL